MNLGGGYGALLYAVRFLVAQGVYGYVVIPGCNPGYLTAEGARMHTGTPEDLLKVA